MMAEAAETLSESTIVATFRRDSMYKARVHKSINDSDKP